MLKVGDFITTYSSGYFRVEQILERYAQESANGYIKGEKMPSIIISKQVFNQNFEFTLGYDKSDYDDCKKVSDKVMKVIDEFFSNNPKKLLELNSYDIPRLRKNKNIILTLEKEELERLKVMLYQINHKFSLNDLKLEFIKNKLENTIGNKGKNTYMLCLVNIDLDHNKSKEELYVFDKIKKF